MIFAELHSVSLRRVRSAEKDASWLEMSFSRLNVFASAVAGV